MWAAETKLNGRSLPIRFDAVSTGRKPAGILVLYTDAAGGQEKGRHLKVDSIKLFPWSIAFFLEGLCVCVCVCRVPYVCVCVGGGGGERVQVSEHTD